jgi:hypothetical protein
MRVSVPSFGEFYVQFSGKDRAPAITDHAAAGRSHLGFLESRRVRTPGAYRVPGVLREQNPFPIKLSPEQTGIQKDEIISSWELPGSLDQGNQMTHLKLQAALDELGRLRDTVKGFRERNAGATPNPDSDAGRALSALEMFTSELHKLDIGKVLGHKI